MATAYGIDYKTVYWSSSNKAVATIDKSSGQLKALSAGTTVITAKDDKSRVKAELTVTVKAIKSISQTPTLDTTVTYTPPKGSDKAVYLSGLDLSKETGVYYTTTKEEYIQTTRFNLYLDKGVKVPVNVIHLINYIMDSIEDTTGYQFYVQHYNGNKYYQGMNYELRKYFKNAKAFKDVDSIDDRLDIVVAHNELEVEAYASSSGGVFLSPILINLLDGNADGLIHELLHVAFYQNGSSMSSTLDEGFTTYFTSKIIENDKLLNCTYDTYSSLSNYQNIISEDTMEDLFINYTAGQSSYQLGFRLMVYIIEKYGMVGYKKIHNNITKEIGINFEPSTAAISKIMKSVLSENFFKDFAKWHSNNLARFGDEDLTSVTSVSDWKIINDILYKYYGKDTEVIIPTSVININPEAFMDCKTMVTVQIPDTVTSIGAGAFYDCDNLIMVTIPDSVTDIHSNTFDDCDKLEDVILPETITRIAAKSFDNCISLTKIKIPSKVTIIENAAFYNCTSLKEVSLPNSLKTIEVNAFTFSGLKSIVIPNSVNDIKYSSFNDCIYLNDVTLPKGLKFLNHATFSGCISLKEISLPKELIVIDELVFESTGLTKITIPDKVTTIGDMAFANCPNLKSITIPSSVKSIGEETFYDSKNVTIYGKKGSYAETYAKKHNIKFSVKK